MPDAPAPSATDELVNKLAAEIRKPAAAPPPPPRSRDEILRTLDEAGKQGAGKFAEEFATTVLMPMQGQNIRAAAQLNRRLTEKDPEVGKLYARYRDKVEARAAELGGDAYIAEKGLDAVVRTVAAEDPAYIEELAETRANAKLAEKEAAIVKAKADAEAKAKAEERPPVEGVHAGTVGAPSTPTPTEADEIAKIEVTRQDEEIARRVFRMTPTEVREQRHQIAKMEKKYGPLGLRQLGGVPIVSLSDCRTGNGQPHPEGD
jgi:hypothetical protein